MKSKKNLPIGIQSFKILRENGNVYVDKTRHIHRMIDEGMFYFLSRSRRFGKSLTVSTMKSLFEGKKDLFDGLWISEHGDWNGTPHPAILIDFNGISHDTPENLKKGLANGEVKTAFLEILLQSFAGETNASETWTIPKNSRKAEKSES